jgi:hypothetical protein
MSSAAHHKQIDYYVNLLKCLFQPYGNYKPEDIKLVTETGMKIAIASYRDDTSVGIFGSPYSDDLIESRPDLHNGDINFYFGMCRIVGREISNCTPENIEDLLKHTKSIRPVSTLATTVQELTMADLKLPILLGTDENDSKVIQDLTVLGNILMAGSTASGKSMFGHSVICSLMATFNTDYVKVLLIDTKRVEFGSYKGLPYLLEDPVLDIGEVFDSLERLTVANSESKYTVVFIDTFSDLMALDTPRFENIIRNLSDRENTFIFMWDSRLSSDVYTENIKECFPTKIIFNTATRAQSNMVCGSEVGSSLKGTGDAVVLSEAFEKSLHVQCSRISIEDAKGVLNK